MSAWRTTRTAFVCLCLLGHASLVLLQSSGWFPLWLSELSLFVPYYWVLPVLLLAVVLALGLHSGLLVLAVCNLLWFATATMGLQWHPDWQHAASEPVGTRLRVLSYNAKAYEAKHRSNGLLELEQEVRSHQADLVAFQDANGWLPDRASTTPAVAPPLFGLPHVVVLGQYVLASRYPLQQCGVGLLGKSESGPNFLHCRMSIGQQKVSVVTVHLVSPRWALTATKQTLGTDLDDWQHNVDTRMAQAGALVSGLMHHPRPLLVLGDLNSPPDSAALALIQRLGLRDTFSEAGNGWGFTHGHSLSRGLDFLRIDHILASPEWHIVNSTVGGSQASQHNPVVADIVLPP